MTFDIYLFAAAVTATFMFILVYGDTVADDIGLKHGSFAGGFARAVLLIVPTIVVALVNWKFAVAGWALRGVLGVLSTYVWRGPVFPHDPENLPIEELERILATGLTGDALAVEIAASRERHLSKP
jgi:hypothetical protein